MSTICVGVLNPGIQILYLKNIDIRGGNEYFFIPSENFLFLLFVHYKMLKSLYFKMSKANLIFFFNFILYLLTITFDSCIFLGFPLHELRKLWAFEPLQFIKLMYWLENVGDFNILSYHHTIIFKFIKHKRRHFQAARPTPNRYDHNQ